MNAPDTEVQQLWDYVCLITTVDIISTQPCARLIDFAPLLIDTFDRWMNRAHVTACSLLYSLFDTDATHPRAAGN